MKDGAIVANSGHFDVEIDVDRLEEIAEEGPRLLRDLAEEYVVDGRRIVLLARGRLINLAAAEGHPAASWTCRSRTRRSRRSICSAMPGESWTPGSPVPLDIDRRIARAQARGHGDRDRLPDPGAEALPRVLASRAPEHGCSSLGRTGRTRGGSRGADARSRGLEPRARQGLEHTGRDPQGEGGRPRPRHLDRSRRGQRDRHDARRNRVLPAPDARSPEHGGAGAGKRGGAGADHQGRREHLLRQPHLPPGRRARSRSTRGPATASRWPCEPRRPFSRTRICSSSRRWRSRRRTSSRGRRRPNSWPPAARPPSPRRRAPRRVPGGRVSGST